MKPIQYRFLLFLFGCIGMRLFLVYLAKTIPLYYLPYLGIITLSIGIGFLFIYFTGIRKTGAEVFGDKIWWNSLRPIHGALYILFSINALQKQRSGWIILFIDVIIGLSAFLYHHWSVGSFYQLLN
jgi:hypothetical protein